MSIRTDLATELKDDLGYLPEGVRYEKTEQKHFTVTHIDILTEGGAYAMKKNIGKYITIDTERSLPELLPRERLRIARKSARELLPIFFEKTKQVLIVGLGNRQVTADSLGPKVCSEVFVTRHILEHIPDFLDIHSSSVCAIAPGVLGVTGLESFEVVKGLVKTIEPTLVIIIDALAARNTDRLGASIQITDTGIVPGGGLGNHREELSRKTLGVPVIAIGIPTVVYTGTIVADALEEVLNQLPPNEQKLLRKNTSVFRSPDLVVTPKNIDVLTDYSAKFIAEMLDFALNPHISRSEIDEIRS